APALSAAAWKQLETGLVVISWFVLNISIASSTKWIFVQGKICIQDTGCQTYKFPIAITVIHMLFSWVLCRIYILTVRGGVAGHCGKSQGLTWRQQLKEIMPLSLCFALSVAMGNLSLKYIYPSFNQMLGSMSPLITVLLAVLLQRKSFPLKTWLSMPVICAGLAVCSLKELNFNALGAFYCTGATVLRALKSLIQGRPGSPVGLRKPNASIWTCEKGLRHGHSCFVAFFSGWCAVLENGLQVATLRRLLSPSHKLDSAPGQTLEIQDLG
ncbi:unnamed protein product, partial [Effrenium voratum]